MCVNFSKCFTFLLHCSLVICYNHRLYKKVICCHIYQRRGLHANITSPVKQRPSCDSVTCRTTYSSPQQSGWSLDFDRIIAPPWFFSFSGTVLEICFLFVCLCSLSCCMLYLSDRCPHIWLPLCWQLTWGDCADVLCFVHYGQASPLWSCPSKAHCCTDLVIFFRCNFANLIHLRVKLPGPPLLGRLAAVMNVFHL